ncbi:hypothetical protein [uncultured Cohaesibacter sp.]|nr:hypothetical protein [uncultured Cohaesibacter sp.]
MTDYSSFFLNDVCKWGLKVWPEFAGVINILKARSAIRMETHHGPH